jgi:hypothetical protein
MSALSASGPRGAPCWSSRSSAWSTSAELERHRRRARPGPEIAPSSRSSGWSNASELGGDDPKARLAGGGGLAHDHDRPVAASSRRSSTRAIRSSSTISAPHAIGIRASGWRGRRTAVGAARSRWPGQPRYRRRPRPARRRPAQPPPNAAVTNSRVHQVVGEHAGRETAGSVP